MSVQDTVINKLFDGREEILDVKFFPGPDATNAPERIWAEFDKALVQLDSGMAEVSNRWTGTTPARDLATFLAAQ